MTDAATIAAELRAEIAELKTRVSRLERGDVRVCRRKAKKPKHVPTVSEFDYLDRWRLWHRYWLLKREEVTGKVYNQKKGESVPTSQAFFCQTTQRISSPSELSRWLKRRGIGSGSTPDKNIRIALQEAIDGLSQGKAVTIPIDVLSDAP